MDKMTQLENELYKEYTKNNYHTEAVMVLAMQSERFDLLAELAGIADRHRLAGYLASEDYDLRHRIENAIKEGVEL